MEEEAAPITKTSAKILLPIKIRGMSDIRSGIPIFLT
jgi:hypothetical protein